MISPNSLWVRNVAVHSSPICHNLPLIFGSSSFPLCVCRFIFLKLGHVIAFATLAVVQCCCECLSHDNQIFFLRRGTGEAGRSHHLVSPPNISTIEAYHSKVLEGTNHRKMYGKQNSPLLSTHCQ